MVQITEAKSVRGPTMGSVPLFRAAWEDLTAWMARRPACASDALFVSLRRSGDQPEPAPLTPK